MDFQESPLAQMIVVKDGEYTATQMAHSVGTAVLRDFQERTRALTDSSFTEDEIEWVNTGHRKIVRHARGAKWERAVSEGGNVYTEDGIEVLVHGLCRTDNVPNHIRRTQVSGIKTVPADTPFWGHGHLIITVDKDLSPGKAAAAVGHIMNPILHPLRSEHLTRWKDDGFKFTVVSGVTDPHDEFFVADNGHTEVAAGTVTVSAHFDW